MRSKNSVMGLLFASPWILGFLILTLYPILISFYYALTEFNIFQPPKFVGLDNYSQLIFDDSQFMKSLYNTLYLTIIGTPINLICALAIALLLNMKIKGLSIYRTIFYLPSIVPVAASSLLWIWILNSQYGLLNSIINMFGFVGPNWLADPAMTKPSLILIGVWAVGNTMIIFLASLQDVPTSLYESAEIDGAGTWTKFIRITLPSISPIILFQVIIQVIGNFQYFTQAYFIAGSGGGLNAVSGGPENSILVYALYLYQVAFSYLKMGKASAMAWILFIIVALVTWIIFKTSKKWVTYGEEQA